MTINIRCPDRSPDRTPSVPTPDPSAPHHGDKDVGGFRDRASAGSFDQSFGFQCVDRDAALSPGIIGMIGS